MAEITKTFASKGLKLRYGRWTRQEKQLLHANFEEFVKNNEDEIGNPVDFVNASDEKARVNEVRRYAYY